MYSLGSVQSDRAVFAAALFTLIVTITSPVGIPYNCVCYNSKLVTITGKLGTKSHIVKKSDCS